MRQFAVVLVVSAFALHLITPVVKNAYAQQEVVVKTDTPVGVDTQATASSFTDNRVNYELPYPGMLPDNPLYFLKTFRDMVVKFLINDPLKRARFSLLTAQKRMYAAKLLTNKGKYRLAIETLSKSNDYLEDAYSAIRQEEKINYKSMDINPFLEQFMTVTDKHKEILDAMKTPLDMPTRQMFAAGEERLAGIKEKVARMYKLRQ